MIRRQSRAMRHTPFLICGLMLLAGCAKQGQESSSPQSTATGAGGPVVIATPGVAEEMKTSGRPFPAVPAGYRGLGGAFSTADKRVVVAPNMETTQGDDLSIGLAHGMAILAYSDEDPNFVAKSDCKNAGASPETAIKVASLAKRGDEIKAVIACARLIYPESRVETAQLIADETRYLSQLILQTPEGKHIVVYTDVTGYAEQLVSELH